MSTIKNIGVVGCQLSEEFFTASKIDDHNFHLKKLFFGNQLIPQSVTNNYPDSEIVSDIDSIMADETIDLVIVSSGNLQYARVAMDAGKPTRII